VRAEPATVGYHLVIARRQDPGLEAEHHAAAPVPYPSPTDLARMDEVITWIRSVGRLPRDRSEDQEERSMARWLSERRREAADGSLSPGLPGRPRAGPRVGREPPGSSGRGPVA
jgi:hypothetical protein